MQNSKSFRRIALGVLLTGTCLVGVQASMAADFTVTNGSTATTSQAIGAGANETGIIEAGGTIATTTINTDAAQSSSAGGTITNNGTITTTNSDSFGIDSSAANNVITNNGSITTTGNNSEGINLSGATSQAINNGTITVNTGNADGIVAQGGAAGATITNTGSVTSQGAGNAVLTFVADTTLVNSGTLLSDGTSIAVVATGTATDFSLNNSGSIRTTGANAHGVSFDATGNSIINSGTITTEGGSANAINAGANADGQTTTNTGTLNATGTGFAYFNAGDNTTFTNGGTVISQNATSLEVQGTGNTVVLLPGSSVNNGINFTNPGTVRYDLANVGAGGAIISHGDITGTVTTEIVNANSAPSEVAVVQTGNNVVAVTADSFASNIDRQIVTDSTKQVGAIITQRQQNQMRGVISGVSSGSEMLKGAIMWLEGFGSYRKRPEDGDSAFSRSKSWGVLAGVDLPENESGYSYGLYAGGFAGEQKLGELTFKKVDSTGALFGGYIARDWNDYKLSLDLSAGIADSDSDRFVGGSVAQADYKSYFFSPEFTVMRNIDLDKANVVPSFSLRYTGQYVEDFDETGTIDAQSVDSRDYHTIGARALVNTYFDKFSIKDGLFSTSLRAGFEAETEIGDSDVDLVVLGNNISFDPDGGEDTIDAVLGFNFSYEFAQSTVIYLDGEGYLGLNEGDSSDNQGGILRAGLRWTF